MLIFKAKCGRGGDETLKHGHMNNTRNIKRVIIRIILTKYMTYDFKFSM